ncbi:MAG: AraC family transcriptional regulator, partial [Pseudomonadales bacterium]|nr:AraC family transcriptional regulator [Pseudomonadales bacterium]
MLSPYINVSFLSGFDELVVSRGGEPGRFYEAVGLDRRVASGEAQLIPHDLFFQLLETTTIGLKFPDLALHLAQRQDMTVLAPLNPVLRQCVSVKDALETIIKYLKLIISGYQVEMEVQEDVVKLSFDVELPYVRASSVFQDYSLAIAVSVLHGLLGRSYPIRACYFIRAEANQNRIEAYARFFGCAVSFGNPTLALTVDKAILSQDINRLIEQIDRRIQQALYFSQESFTHLVS